MKTIIHSRLTEENWAELRVAYFNECVDTHGNSQKINLAPHDLFQWFRANLK